MDAQLSKLSDKWLTRYEEARTWFLSNGHLSVPSIGDDASLYKWLSRQRIQRRDRRLDSEQIGLLDEIGMIWTAGGMAISDRKFAKFIKTYNRFAADGGDITAQSRRSADDQTRWIVRTWHELRADFNRGLLSAERRAALEATGLPMEEHSTAEWERNFQLLEEYKKEFGCIDVPTSRSPKRYASLYNFLHYQRRLQRTGSLDARKKLRLDRLGIDWTPSKPVGTKLEMIIDRPMCLILRAEAYVDQYGSLDVPVHFEDDPMLPGMLETAALAIDELNDSIKSRLRKLGWSADWRATVFVRRAADQTVCERGPA